jgi:hypothetical protein
MDELTKATFKEHSDTLKVVVNFTNDLSADVGKLQDDFARIKSWARTMLAAEIENAANELRVEISGTLAESVETARTRAKQAADELRDMEALLSAGPCKSVRLVHDSEGRAIGALIHQH